MNRLLVALLLCAGVFAKPLDKTLQLKKDEVYGGELQLGKFKKPVFFRWTLYKDQGLVVHLNINHFPYQFILYPDFQRDSFRVAVFKERGGASSSEVEGDHTPPFLMLSFKKFDTQKEIATLRLRASNQLKWVERP
ncbi:hypothetical protein [Helicobacter bizzozeronii]|uniref:hypothetical protein n=1 Tax=Helicobacter bizzozeronii TaxID=56877 RepID=UPI001F2E0881|nr:hypothetical protein [Helicobacter bizzozeronii]